MSAALDQFVTLVQTKRVDEEYVGQIATHLLGEALECIDLFLHLIESERKNLELLQDSDCRPEVAAVILGKEGGQVEEEVESGSGGARAGEAVAFIPRCHVRRRGNKSVSRAARSARLRYDLRQNGKYAFGLTEGHKLAQNARQNSESQKHVYRCPDTKS